MMSRYHPYRHRRPRYRGRRYYRKIRLRWPYTPFDRALDIELQGMLDAIKSEIVAAFRILEEHRRARPCPRTATELAILEQYQHLRRT